VAVEVKLQSTSREPAGQLGQYFSLPVVHMSEGQLVFRSTAAEHPKFFTSSLGRDRELERPPAGPGSGDVYLCRQWPSLRNGTYLSRGPEW
jgi:hypothetical protein